MDIGQHVSPSDGRPLSGSIVDVFPTIPPQSPMVAVIWDHDKIQERRWFPVSQLKLIDVPVLAAEPPQKSPARSKLRTWHKEAAVVGAVLTTVAWAKDQPIEWLGALAVFLTFMHAQVSFRLSESESRKTLAQVDYHWKAQYYFLAKETCWFLYFIWLGAWSALIGVIVFLLYPLWRKWHLSKKS